MIPGYSILGKHTIGHASDSVNGQAVGAIIPVTASLITGVASGGASAAGATLAIASSVIAGDAHAGASANGATLIVATSAIAGSASAGAHADGSTLSVTTSLKSGYVAVGYSTESMIPGDAGPGRLSLGQVSTEVNGFASGTTLSIATSIKPGYVAVGLSGSSSIPGDEGPGRFALGQLGADINSVDGHASGVLLPPIVVSVVPGVATVSEETPAVERRMPPPYRHKSSVDGFAQGALITVGVSVISGHAEGEHTIIVRAADGSTRTIGIVGATHEELSDDEFILAAINDDLDLWLMDRHDREEEEHEMA